MVKAKIYIDKNGIRRFTNSNKPVSKWKASKIKNKTWKTKHIKHTHTAFTKDDEKSYLLITVVIPFAIIALFIISIIGAVIHEFNITNSFIIGILFIAGIVVSIRLTILTKRKAKKIFRKIYRWFVR